MTRAQLTGLSSSDMALQSVPDSKILKKREILNTYGFGNCDLTTQTLC